MGEAVLIDYAELEVKRKVLAFEMRQKIILILFRSWRRSMLMWP